MMYKYKLADVDKEPWKYNNEFCSFDFKYYLFCYVIETDWL